jgi:asparagine synthase (glutamine-hydrolysing)
MAKLFLDPDRWSGHGATFARGQAWDAHGRLLRATDLARQFEATPHAAGWGTLAKSLNGMYAAIRVAGDDVRGVVDRLRSIPLFFASTSDGLAIGDTAWPVLQSMPSPRRDTVAEAEFRLTGYTTGASTLYDGLNQVPAGHVLASTGSARGPELLHRYFAFEHRDFVHEPEAALIDHLDQLHERVFRRLLDDLGGRPIIVPLSGGYDSRLIGVMLRDLGARDVLCYTYGIEGNWEARISRELAAHLGFRWTMVPYSAARWRAWRDLPAFSRYFHDAGNASSSPHFQDWPAVHELHAGGLLSRDAVFVPGHSGDFLAGSHVPPSLVRTTGPSRDEVLKSIFDAHYNLWDWPRDPSGTLQTALAARVERITGPIVASSPEAAASAFERWDCAERQAKFIVNSVRVYESLGYEWRLPLFDGELMDFWSRIPVARRLGRRLYFAYAAARQSLPVTEANLDRAPPAAATVKFIERAGLKPLALRARRVLRRARWRQEYEGGTMGWYALVDPEYFRNHYTGREIAHAFFAQRYLDVLPR